MLWGLRPLESFGFYSERTGEPLQGLEQRRGTVHLTFQRLRVPVLWASSAQVAPFPPDGISSPGTPWTRL